MGISIDPSVAANASVGTVLGRDPGLNELKSEDFLRLLVAQLTQQDPFEPVQNQDLLNQVSAIRNMEMNTTLNTTLQTLAEQGEGTAMANFMLTQTLQTLALQSDMGTGANLIGKKVTAMMLPAETSADDVDAEPEEVTGIVVGVRLVDGDVKLDLDTGKSVFLMDVSQVTLPSDPVADDGEESA
jgi:flagellar basal-body rod modification protein FlgD